MIDLYVVDTHALAWFLSGNAKLGTAADAILADPASRLLVPAIVLAELCRMIEKGTTPIGPADRVLDMLSADPRIQIDPLDVEIVRITVTLTAVPEMHDRQVVASALRASGTGQTVALLTTDAKITESGLVAVVW